MSIRPMRGSDAEGLIALYAGLNTDDQYRRFFSGHPPPESFVRKMTNATERGGFGLIAVIEGPDSMSRIVGEATYELLPDGDGELGITVAEDARGWLGPYLLDALVEAAAARGVPNLEADVLVANRRMLTMLRARGYAVVDHDEQPAVVRVAIGTTQRVPTWPGNHERPRLLVEVPGGRWHAEEAARAAGFQVLACPGPLLGWSHCPALRGEPCPLAAGADLIVDAVPHETGRSLLDAHRRVHPSVPICVELPSGESDLDANASKIPRGTSDTVVIGILERLAKKAPAPVRESPQRQNVRQSLDGPPDGPGAPAGGEIP
ncbi:MAG: GNAT family N-acetyltransferase [Acidimicrobiales bacterium]